MGEEPAAGTVNIMMRLISRKSESIKTMTTLSSLSKNLTKDF